MCHGRFTDWLQSYQTYVLQISSAIVYRYERKHTGLVRRFSQRQLYNNAVGHWADDENRQPNHNRRNWFNLRLGEKEHNRRPELREFHLGWSDTCSNGLVSINDYNDSEFSAYRHTFTSPRGCFCTRRVSGLQFRYIPHARGHPAILRVLARLCASLSCQLPIAIRWEGYCERDNDMIIV